jgi:hypothetical protein
MILGLILGLLDILSDPVSSIHRSFLWSLSDYKEESYSCTFTENQNYLIHVPYTVCVQQTVWDINAIYDLGNTYINDVDYSLMSGESSYSSAIGWRLFPLPCPINIHLSSLDCYISPLTSYPFDNSRPSPLLPTTLFRSCFHFEVDFA